MARVVRRTPHREIPLALKVSFFANLARVASGGVLAAVLAGCGTAQPQAGPAAPLGQDVAKGSMGNIYWSRARLNLAYPSKSYVYATLTYWAPNGYLTAPHSCKRKGTFAAVPHRRSGNPHGYMNVVYWFKATAPGPNTCALTAILKNTGSPPLSTIELAVAR
jgi:hypothetical protein